MKKLNRFSIVLSTMIAIILGVIATFAITRGINFALNSIPGKIVISVEKNTANIESVGSTSGDDTYRDKSVTIRIGGDVMLDRNVRKLGEQYGYDSLFTNVTPLFTSANIGVVNLEGPITSYPSKTVLPDGTATHVLTFTFDPTSTEALANAGIKIVSLANNHTDNFGMIGLKETRKWLAESGIQYFGDPWNSSSTEAVIEKNGIKVAFVGYHAFQPGFDRVLATIRRLKTNGDFVIVMPHWGEEYVAIPSELLRSKARAMITAGASAIVGAHPHVIMDHEWIGGVPVFYSLGNLLFDQYFSPETMRGNIIELHLTKEGEVPQIDRVRVYETSIASKKNVTVSDQVVDIPMPTN
jgi:gamma-polyglutamate biosynthesis protein CapA